MTLGWYNFPIVVDFIVFIDWMRFRGCWVPCTMTFFDTYNQERYLLVPNVRSLNTFSLRDIMHNQQLPKCPIALLNEADDYPPENVLRGNVMYLHDLLKEVMDRCGKKGTCCIATTNLADYQYLHANLINHEVIHFEKDVDREEVIAEFCKRREQTVEQCGVEPEE